MTEAEISEGEPEIRAMAVQAEGHCPRGARRQAGPSAEQGREPALPPPGPQASSLRNGENNFLLFGAAPCVAVCEVNTLPQMVMRVNDLFMPHMPVPGVQHLVSVHPDVQWGSCAHKQASVPGRWDRPGAATFTEPGPLAAASPRPALVQTNRLSRLHCSGRCGRTW